MVKKYMEISDQWQVYLSPIILCLTALAFVISDFSFKGFSFADFLFMGLFAYLALSAQYRLDKKQVLYVLVPVLILLLNVILSIQHNPLASPKLLLTQSVKLIFYLTFIMGLYTYIKRHNLSKRFLNINKYMAFFAIVIGIYITIALYSDGKLHYEFIWRFTRKHPTSYEFQGNPAIIRTRSFFSEPAHFGFYLNVILASLLFNVQKFKVKGTDIYLLILGILSTLSYSMIGIAGLIVVSYGMKKLKNAELKWTNHYWFIVLVSIVLLVVFWDFLYTTLFQRTINIITGQDSSTINRLFNSWQYVGDQSLLYGNGVAHTPTITNNFAYILSDFGFIGFIPFGLVMLFFIYKNWAFGLVIVLLNFSRGSYIGPSFWIVLLFFFLYSFKDNRDLNRF